MTCDAKLRILLKSNWIFSERIDAFKIKNNFYYKNINN